MKKLLFSIACIVFGSSVYASQWLPAGGSNDERWLLNTHTTKQGALINVTWMRNFTYEGQKMSQKIVDSMDCSKKQYTQVSVVTYKGHNFSGEIFPYKSPNIGKVSKVNLNSVDGYAYETFCPSDKPVEMVWRISNPSEPGHRTDFIDAKSCREFAAVLNYSKPGYRCNYVPR